MKTRRLTFYKLAVYYLLFAAAWTLRKILLNVDVTWGYQLLEAAVKTLIWVVPCVFLIKHYEKDLTVPLRELFTNKVRWLPFLPLFAAFTIYILAGELIFTGRIGSRPGFEPTALIGGFLFVGITEEMVFRGWLLNAMLRMMKTSCAVVLNAVLFLLIHFPGWIVTGRFLPNFYHLGFVSLMILSAIFSITFIKSKNLLVPIALHMYWDLLTLTFFSM